MSRKYFVTYSVEPHPEGIADEEIPEGAGACDCLVITSVLGVPGDPKTGLSVVTASVNGQSGKPLDAEQRFALWAAWAFELSKELPPGGKKELTTRVHEALMEWFMKKKTGRVPPRRPIGKPPPRDDN